MIRLTSTPYADLLKEAESLQVYSVQDILLLSSELSDTGEHQVAFMSDGVCVEATHVARKKTGCRVSHVEVKAVLQSSRHWREGAKLRAISHAQQLKAMPMTGQNPLPVLSHDKLYDKPCQDPTIGELFVDIGWRPSRWERVHDPQKTPDDFFQTKILLGHT